MFVRVPPTGRYSPSAVGGVLFNGGHLQPGWCRPALGCPLWVHGVRVPWAWCRDPGLHTKQVGLAINGITTNNNQLLLHVLVKL